MIDNKLSWFVQFYSGGLPYVICDVKTTGLRNASFEHANDNAGIGGGSTQSNIISNNEDLKHMVLNLLIKW